MKHNNLITSLYTELKKRADVRAVVPMGYVADIPILSIQEEHLLAKVPFLRYKTTGVEDHTLVFPIRFVMEFVLPQRRLIRFRDLEYDELFANINYNKAIGFFRHDAVKDLDNDSFQELKAKTLTYMDRLCESLFDETHFSNNDDAELRTMIQKILEPSLYAFYKALDNDFYTKYIKK